MVDNRPIATYVSQNIKNILGYDPDKFLGKMDYFWKKLIHPEDIDNIKIVGQIGEEIINEYRVKDRRGEYHWIYSQHKIMENDECGLEAIGSFWDITERKQAEEQQRMIDKIDTTALMAGGIAHDFNNILTICKGNVSLAKFYLKSLGDKPLKTIKLLEDAEQSFDQAGYLTHQLLTLSKGDSPVLKATSLKNLLTESVYFALRGSKVDCQWEIEENLYPVEVDEGQINQVINNLVINAIQSMPEGGTLTVRAQNITFHGQNPKIPLEKGAYVKVSFADQGCGISDEVIEKIFDPYFSTKKHGRGLGLATSFSIINKHGGYITVDSKEGVGTTFHIYLRASTKKMVKEESNIPKEIYNSMQTNKKVLIMDDKDKVRRVFYELLTSMGFDVTCTRNGEEAVNIYKQANKSFDIVFLDLTVPGGMGGKETIKKLKAMDPSVTAIAASGYSEDPIHLNYSDYGFAAAITKPFSMAELHKVLHSVIC
ncbi:hybrid sensor histidine kinase/response regulator [Natranaerobius thermophilus]|uniref:Stage 0 sporulation protein A homolog n=1 Tax=Natranaerobius thermophilus (strain ATCC BAA-1301 / DSM 18059 / JW/NM-WN-LF) TaxID=457570 RepID=B2A5Z5_NATTJ|nr:ATP-binding protein [Natranaerobius thermophilus]ACB85412.1 PAS/PAC sensor hybrid histidine kinase [Natranaerobius thermophilus JW/NM-WN-LF]